MNCGFRQRALVAVSFATLAMSSAARAGSGDQGTEEDRAACTPDVFRLCGSEIPDVDGIVACLRGNMAALSEPCRAVMSRRETGVETARTKREGR
jgi:hypothetical protein